jgi:GH15 family glucan-1,4-alpha-glucosidase
MPFVTFAGACMKHIVPEAYVARPIVLSNGELHVGLNKYGLVHDFYYPYVGFENHAAGANLRHKVGVWIDGTLSWLDNENEWTFDFRYPHTALIGHTQAKNDKLGVVLEFDDCVDAEISTFMRNIHVVNLQDKDREIRLFMYQAFAIGDSRSNTDTAQYLPDSDAILHYRGRRAFVIGGSHNNQPFDQYSIGLFGIEGHEGTFYDAEDGLLGGNNVEHGRVDSMLGFTLQVAAHGSERVHYWVSAGMSIREALYIHKIMQEQGLSSRLHATAAWWQKWLAPAIEAATAIPEEYREIFLQSIMIIKSQMDKRGAIIASTDSTMLNYSRDAYGYSWPRDGGYALWPLIRLGYKDEPYRFFEFTKRGLHPNGYLMHKYRADGALGSSWHPYIHDDVVAPPIQEDETAIVVFMFAQYYNVQKDPSLLKDFYGSLVKPMANFLTEYVDEHTGLPKPSYDLWEQLFATTTYSVAVTYGALIAATELAATAGDKESAVRWQNAADDIRQAAHKHLYNAERKTFYRSVTVKTDGTVEHDPVLDTSSVFGVYLFGLFDTDSEELTSSVATMIETFAKAPGGPGLPRYEDDDYRRTDPAVSGNWWHITTLWMAQYQLDMGDRDGAIERINWVKSHALKTGMLGEQVDPANDRLVSPAPLTWSHAELVSTLLDLAQRKS